MYYVVDPAQFTSLCVLMSNTLSIACRNPPRRRALLAVTSVMFFLGTCDAVATVALIGITMRLFKEVVQESSDPLHLLRVLNVLRLTEIVRTTLNIVVTDLLFVLHLLPFMIFTLSINECSQLHRCYIIWDSRKKVLILPALCILATVGGRIWYRGRGMHTILGPNFGKTYNSALALILESGAIYCFCAILLVASQTTQTAGEFNIAPTLILVRIGMDQERIQQTTSVSDQLPSGGAIRFRAPANLEDESCPVVDFK
ncbi:hypothetical protein B0H19DRAFT_1242950 [Mycena capillaripes]|nr:hypothetical protein B0H19DRAFT_1242950 [Mycena capillaripes]